MDVALFVCKIYIYILENRFSCLLFCSLTHTQSEHWGGGGSSKLKQVLDLQCEGQRFSSQNCSRVPSVINPTKTLQSAQQPHSLNRAMSGLRRLGPEKCPCLFKCYYPFEVLRRLLCVWLLYSSKPCCSSVSDLCYCNTHTHTHEKHLNK